MEIENPQPIKREIKIQHQGGGAGGSVYGLGMIGACVYYMRGATTPKERGMAFLKALVWPAYLVYEAFMFLEKK